LVVSIFRVENSVGDLKVVRIQLDKIEINIIGYKLDLQIQPGFRCWA
jgi:hypothetical protein